MTLLVGITVLVAAIAVLAAIVIVALGGGGELSVEHPDHPPLALPGRRPAAGTDAALLRLPLGLVGYHKQITDEALERFASELTERDTRIAVLEQELAEARQRYGGGSSGPRTALPPGRSEQVSAAGPLATRADRAFGTPSAPEGGDPFATRTDAPAPATREEPIPASTWPAASPVADPPTTEPTAERATGHTGEHTAGLADEAPAEPADTADEPAEPAARTEPAAHTESAGHTEPAGHAEPTARTEPVEDVEDPRPVRKEDAE